MIQYLSEKLDRLYAPGLVRTAFDRSRARLTALVFIFFLTLGTLYGTLYALSSGKRVEAILVFSAVAASFGIPVLLKKGSNVYQAGNFALLLVFFLFNLIIFRSGGLRSETIHWLLLIPILSLIISNRKWASGWLLINSAEVLFLAAAELTRWFPLDVYPSATSTALRMAAYIILFLISFGLVAQFDINLRAIVTELKHAQRDLEHARREAEKANQAKSRFLAGMSHELRTPLNAMLGFSQVLYEAPDLPPAYRQYAETMFRSGQHLLGMINDVLDVSKIEAGRMEKNAEPVHLPAMLRDVAAMFEPLAKEKNIQFEFDLSGTLPDWIRTDPGKFRQILINLVGNAIKFTDHGKVGFFCAETTFEQFDKGQFSSRFSSHESEKPCLVIRVLDSGRGIDATHLADIFQPFKQVGNQKDGSGLGLAISWNLIQLLGGEISVSSRISGGTTFRVYLPLDVIDEAYIPKERPFRKPIHVFSPNPAHLLLVDDVATNILLLKTLLEPLGFVCTEASDGRSALKAFENGHFHAILLDIKLPDIDGPEVMKRIRSSVHGAHLPIIAVTASVFEETGADLLAAGFSGFMLKPFHYRELIGKLEQHAGIEFEFDSAT